jgi:hypothetical protein
MRTLCTAIAVSAALVTPAISSGTVTANGNRAEVTTGHFAPLPDDANPLYDVGGRAVMVRIGHDPGRTIVISHVSGLDHHTTYPSHVHNGTCAEKLGHYKDDPGGPVDATNEIWPAVTTNAQGRGVGTAIHAARARQEAQSIVVHHPDTGARLACADLE